MTYSEYRGQLRNLSERYTRAYKEHGATSAVTKNLKVLKANLRNSNPEYSNKYSYEFLTGREYKPYA